MQLRLVRQPYVIVPERAPAAIAPRDAALLTWLAIEGPTPRARMAQLLWPDAEPEAARNTLRQRLFQMRRSLGAALVDGASVLRLADGVGHDLTDADDVLGDLTEEFGGEFGAWLTLQRQRRHQRVRGTLGEQLGTAEREGRWDEALPLATELLARDPLSEDAHRRLIRLHYLRGDRAAALLAFDRCERMLKDEVGARPSSETLDLLRSIEVADEPPAAARGMLPMTLLRPPRDAGRTTEREALLSAWKAGQPFVVLGDPGIGKSRLLQAVATGWRGAVIVPARPGDRDVPLAVIARLVDVLAPVAGSWLQGPDGVVLRERLAGVAPAVTGGAVVAGADRPPLPNLVPREQGPLLLGLLREALRAVPPPALLFDDWQFADEASVALLDDVLARPELSELRRGYASRRTGDTTTGTRVDALAAHAQWHRVTLQGLDALQVVALVESLGLRGVDVRSLAQALWQRVGGNPLYLLETLRHQHEQGKPLTAEALASPPRVRDLVEARVGELPSSARQLLQVAAVAGVDFDVELAEGVSGRHALALADDWRLLERVGLFDSRGIAHDLHAEGALAVLPVAIGRTLHGRVAAWLEGRANEPARLAAHWRAADDDARALPHLLAAARRARAAALSEATFALFREAGVIATQLGGTDRAFDIWFDAADAASEIGTTQQMRECVDAMAALARTPRQLLRTRFAAQVIDWLDGRIEEAIQRITPLLSDAIALQDARMEGEIRMGLGQHAVGAGRYDEAIQQLAAAERLIADIGDTGRAATIGANIARVMSYRGQPARALAYLRQHRYTLARDDVTIQATEAIQHARLGDRDGALAAAQRAVERARQVSIVANECVVLLRDVVEALRWCGAFAQALDVIEELAPRMDTLHPHGPLARAVLYLHLGRADLARPHLDRVAASGQLSDRVQAMRDFLRLQADCLGGDVLHWRSDALEEPDLNLVAEWLLWSGMADASPWPLAVIAERLQMMEQEHAVLYARPVRALLAWRHAQAGDAQGAADLLAALSPMTGDGMASVACTALCAGRAMRLLGREGDAARVQQLGAQWLRRAVSADALQPFRDSFLQRHPLHRALLAESARPPRPAA